MLEHNIQKYKNFPDPYERQEYRARFSTYRCWLAVLTLVTETFDRKQFRGLMHPFRKSAAIVSAD